MDSIKNATTYHTLDEIRLRKEELQEKIQGDNQKFASMWNQLFLQREKGSKGDYIAEIVSNAFVAFDAFMLVRKLLKTYGFISRRSKKRK